MKHMLVVATCLVWTSAGCSDDSDYETRTNPQAAVQLVGQLGTMSTAQQSGSADVAASGALTLGSLSQNIIVPVLPEQEQPQARVAVDGPAALVGECTCTESGCQFSGCEAEDGSWSIEGSLSVDGDRYTFDLAIEQSSEYEGIASSTSLEVAGDITISPTLIDGDTWGSGDTQVTISDEDYTETIHADWNWETEAKDIVLDESRCPVSGSLYAYLRADAETSRASVNYHGSGTVTFGPSCGLAQ